MKRWFLIAVAFAFCTPAGAQSYPDHPVRLVVGFPPGGSSDTVARVVAQHLSPLLGQPVVVENKPGAGGVIGSDIVAKAQPDGHTLLLTTAANATTAAMRKELPFDPVESFAWVSTITTYPFVIATAASSPIQSLEDLIARAKKSPGKVTYSSAGIGTSHHLLGEWLSSEAGIEMVHIPFKGGTSPLTEVLAGRVDIMVETMTLVLPHIKSGKLRGLAVTSPQPKEYLPEVPAAAKTLPGFVFQSWLGIATTAGTPRPVVDKLNQTLHKVLAEPEVQKRLSALGGGAAPISPEQNKQQVITEIARWKKLVESRKLERN